MILSGQSCIKALSAPTTHNILNLHCKMLQALVGHGCVSCCRQLAPALHSAAAFPTFGRPAKAAGTTSGRAASVVAMAGEQQDEQPKNFPYTHL